jgi:hypothetical protein
MTGDSVIEGASMTSLAIGTFFYLLWGLLHIGAGVSLLRLLEAEGTATLMLPFGLPRHVILPAESRGVIGSLAGQHAANLATLGLGAIIVPVWTMRTKNVFGLWLNIIVVGLVEIAFLAAFYVPGYVRGVNGLLGPLLFVLAALFGSLAFYNRVGR